MKLSITLNNQSGTAVHRALDSWNRLQALTQGPYLQVDLAPALEEYQDRLLRLGLEALTLALAELKQEDPQLVLLEEEEPQAQEAGFAPAPEEMEEEEPPMLQAQEEGPPTAPEEMAEPEQLVVPEEVQPEPQAPPSPPEEPGLAPKKLTWEEEEQLLKQKLADADKLINMVCDFKAEAALLLTRDGWYQELARLLQLDLWGAARKETIAELASYLAASIRAVDEVMSMMVPDRQAGAEAMNRVKAMMERVKPIGGQAPPVHGLQLRHVPREGTTTWLEYANLQRDQIQGVTVIPAPPKKSTPKKKAPEAPSLFDEEESEPSRLQPRLDLIQPLTIGQTWVVLGGDPRSDKEVVWKDMFLLDGLSWVPNGGGKKEAPRRVTSICHAMKGGGVQGVILLQGFVPHASSNRLIEAYKTTGVPVFVVNKGYGNSQVLEAVEHRLLGRKPAT